MCDPSGSHLPLLALKGRPRRAKGVFLADDFLVGAPPIRREGHPEFLRATHCSFFNFEMQAAQHLRDIEFKDERLLSWLFGYPPARSWSLLMVEDVVHRMRGGFRGHDDCRHGGNVEGGGRSRRRR